MTIRQYQTYEVDEMVENIEVQPPFLLGRYFGRVKTFDTEMIEFDVVDRGRRIAPFVSPLTPGRVMRRPGYRTMQFKPAYIKLLKLIRPTDTFTRMPGEAYGGAMSPQQRLDRIFAETVRMHMEARDVRLEWMAAQALVTGQITISGEDYPTVVVNFARDPGVSVTLSGGALWTAPTTAKPMDDIENIALLVRRKSRGSVVGDLIMNGYTWSLLRTILMTDPNLWKLYTTYQRVAPTSTFDLGPRQNIEAEFVGNLSGRFNIIVYDGFYHDDNGAEQIFIPNGKVLAIASGGIEGTQYRGAIMDLEAQMEPRDYFVKTWLEKNPSGMQVLSQSAPLVAPRRPNCVGILTVI
jgi:Phage major capsid protein E